jgi:flagellar hook-basal body complex protein FliE
MTVNLSDAVSAYVRAVRPDGQDGLAPRAQDQGGDFASVLRETAGAAVDALREGEVATLRAAAGKADITEVVTAVSQAEITLQTVVAVRDRVIQAYQDILRMPI